MNILTTLPTDTFVTAAFAELLEDVTNLLAAADGRDETTFWRRQMTALNKAQYHFLAGVRPQLAEGAYLLPSASSSGLNVYRLTKLGGVLHCDCKAGQNGILCYHHMLINVLERASELETLAQRRAEEVTSDPTPDAQPNPIPHAAAAAAWVGGQIQLRQRLEATSAYLETLRAQQQRSALPTMDAQHISVQARHAYARAAQPADRRPLFARRDAETFRRHSLSEERAVLLEQRARAKVAA